MQTVQGKDSIISKGKHFQSFEEAFHGASVSNAVIAGQYFSVAASLDVTLKRQGRIKMEEVIVYPVVKDKKLFPSNSFINSLQIFLNFKLILKGRHF